MTEEPANACRPALPRAPTRRGRAVLSTVREIPPGVAGCLSLFAPCDGIFSITTDTRGFLWCATGGGLARFDGSRWTTNPQMTGISALAPDASGGTPGSGK
ncbi:MAG: hypothetical protein GY765_42910 [bacterium]|nr:hypothetical protein [bacterium]